MRVPHQPPILREDYYKDSLSLRRSPRSAWRRYAHRLAIGIAGAGVSASLLYPATLSDGNTPVDRSSDGDMASKQNGLASRDFNSAANGKEAGYNIETGTEPQKLVIKRDGETIISVRGQDKIASTIETIPTRENDGKQQKSDSEIGEQTNLTTIITQACTKTGFDADIAIRIAEAESSLDADAVNASSSARGLFQFTGPTFIEHVHKYASELGFTKIANMVTLDKIPRSDGKLHFKYRLADNIDSDNFYNQAFNPRLNAALACRKMKEEANRIKEDIGITPSAADIYALHFLGPSAGMKFLELYHHYGYHNHAPSDYFNRGAIERNRSIFFHHGGDGPERSIKQVMDVFSDKVGSATVTLAQDAAAHIKFSPQEMPQEIRRLRERQTTPGAG